MPLPRTSSSHPQRWAEGHCLHIRITTLNGSQSLRIKTLFTKNASLCPVCLWSRVSSLTPHCEILGSYLQQPHQHHICRAHFEAEPHSQAEANKWQRMFCLISRSKLTESVVTDKTLMPCSAR